MLVNFEMSMTTYSFKQNRKVCVIERKNTINHISTPHMLDYVRNVRGSVIYKERVELLPAVMLTEKTKSMPARP